MKKYIFSLVLLIPLYIKAEYNEWNFKIVIKTIKGKELFGYGVTLTELNPDSLENTNYLIKTLAKDQNGLYIYRNRIAYKNTSDLAPMYSTEYVLLNKISVFSKSIQSLKISDWEMGSTLSGIENKIKLSDKRWLNDKPIEIVHIYANSYEYDIFIHKKNSRLDALIQKFKGVAKKYEVTNDGSINTEEIREHQELIRKMKGLKVVVISFGNC